MFYIDCVCFQAHVSQCEANVSEHQHYHSQVTDLVDFVQSLRDKLDIYSDTSGDAPVIEVQLGHLQVSQQLVVLKFFFSFKFQFYIIEF